MLFGGVKSATLNMYTFSEEGELIADLSSSHNLPGYMGTRPFLVMGERIFSVGKAKEKN